MKHQIVSDNYHGPPLLGPTSSIRRSDSGSIAHAIIISMTLITNSGLDSSLFGVSLMAS